MKTDGQGIAGDTVFTGNALAFTVVGGGFLPVPGSGSFRKPAFL